MQKKLAKMKKRIMKPKKEDQLDFEQMDSDGSEMMEKKARKKRDNNGMSAKEQARKKRNAMNLAAAQNLGNKVNCVKTANKLIGEIENNELYASDDGLDGFGASRDNKSFGDVDLRGQSLELDDKKVADNKFLQKMKTKKQLQEEN